MTICMAPMVKNGWTAGGPGLGVLGADLVEEARRGGGSAASLAGMILLPPLIISVAGKVHESCLPCRRCAIILLDSELMTDRPASLHVSRPLRRWIVVEHRSSS